MSSAQKLASSTINAYERSELSGVKLSLVGEEGVEPSILAEHDFESCAYTSSATHPTKTVCKPKLAIPVSPPRRNTPTGVIVQWTCQLSQIC